MSCRSITEDIVWLPAFDVEYDHPMSKVGCVFCHVMAVTKLWLICGDQTMADLLPDEWSDKTYLAILTLLSPLDLSYPPFLTDGLVLLPKQMDKAQQAIPTCTQTGMNRCNSTTCYQSCFR